MTELQSPILIIFLSAFAYSLLSTYITRKFGNYKRIKEIQETFRAISKEINEASKSSDKNRLDEAIARQNAAMPLLWESMVLQIKPLIFLLPVLFIIPSLLRDNFPTFSIKLPFALPIFIQNLENFPNWRDTFGPVGWFWLSVIFSALLVSLALKIYETHINKIQVPK
ncbi:MAG: EMC3/TMCO1 family protein [Candidatus Anstonellales archaeon]